MNKVAKLVEVSFTVRVIVNEDATEEQIIAASYDKLQDRLDNREVGENIVDIQDDFEVPFDPEHDVDDGITNKMVENASHYLSDDDEISTREMIKRIMEHEDENDYIDNVDGVVVWQPLEYKFTCSDFLDMI